MEHEITYFVYCWYRDAKRMNEPMGRDGQRHGHAIHEGLFRSRCGDRFRFAIMWETHNAGVAADEKDLLDNLLPYWVETYFSRPNYLRVDGHAVLFVYATSSIDRLAAPFGGPEHLPRILDRLRDAAARRGVNLLLPMETRNANPEELRRVKALGFDAAFAYCWHPPQRYPSADEAIAMQLAGLRAWRQAGILPYMATATMGWDPMPWQNPKVPWLNPETMIRFKLSPADFKRLLAQVKQFMDEEPATNFARRMLLLDNWNEWGEGHYIAPQATDGFGYLQAVREVFTKCDNRPDYRRPEKLGLGPYDHGYRRAKSAAPG
jgi:hypothetical protein